MDKTNANSGNAYLKTKVMTASPEELQLMLYDGAIRFCEQARAAVENKEIEESYVLLIKAQKIVSELMSSMRDDLAPDTCANMRRLYAFCYDRLITANLDKNVELIDEALKVIRHIRETWVMLIEKVKSENVQAAQSAYETEKQLQHVGVVGPGMGQGIGSMINFEG